MGKILVPDYYESFRCKCGDCRHPCCDGWGINVSEHEYFTLIGIDCSKRLRNKLDDAFTVSPLATKEAYASIQPNYLEQCPMLDEDGLCLLQKEQGEDVMPLICRLYPRAVKRYGDLHEIVMSCSCEETVELLMQSKEPLTLHEISVPLPFEGITVYEKDEEKDRLRHRVLDLMGNFSLPICVRIRRIGETVCRKAAGQEHGRTEALLLMRTFLEILCRRSKSIRTYGEKALAYLSGKDGDALLASFDEAEDHLYALIPEADLYASRLIANHLLYESFPYGIDCETPDTAFAAFCTAVAIVKVLCVSAMADSDDLSLFTDVFSFANRFIEHSDYYRACNSLSHPDGMETYDRFAPILQRHG